MPKGELIPWSYMPFTTDLARRLGLSHPIIQAPLAGGGDTPDLVAAVSNAGGLGFVGAAYLTPEQVESTAAAVRAKTSRPFGINLFAPLPTSNTHGIPKSMLARLGPYFAELGLLAPKSAPSSTGHAGTNASSTGDRTDAQLAAALESGASCFSFTFGLLSADAVAQIKARKMFLIGTATTVDEALQLEKLGADAIVTQGSEAGGHRGSFATDFAQGMVGTISLVPQVADAVRVPVIASGGIMDGRGIVAALALGAQAVQMGTAFLTCHEAGVPEVYKQAILNAREDQTRITRAFSGRPARGIVNCFMTEIEQDEAAIPPFPIQNSLTRPLRTAAAKQGRAEFLSLWSGQGTRLARRQSAAELIERLAGEMEEAVTRLR
jgi:nitronate monooxygenase